ncbi:esterase [Sodalis sp. (in: enterobacteria)]|uniref:esterase n=1 Tax=Sodalis sp. (in: enterobacteria) TaxID=1898979 RepID=UPI003F36FFAB
MKLNYRLQAARQPEQGLPVVLIHGLFGSLDNVGVLARPLGENHRTLQIDLRNHGLSPHAPTMGYDEMAWDVLALLDALLIERCIVIGHSMGGKVAMTLCALAPARIAQAVVIDMAPVAYQVRRHDAIFAALARVSEAGITQRSDAARLMEQDIDDPGTIQFLLKSFDQGQWRFALDSIQHNYADIIGWRTLPPWPGPILFIRGGNSPYLDDRYRETLRQQFPRARAHVVAGAGHWVHAEKPQAVVRAVARFLTEASAGRGS